MVLEIDEYLQRYRCRRLSEGYPMLGYTSKQGRHLLLYAWSFDACARSSVSPLARHVQNKRDYQRNYDTNANSTKPEHDLQRTHSPR